MDIGTICSVTEGLATAIPPTALVTDTAGVKIPSAIVNLHTDKSGTLIASNRGRYTQFQTSTIMKHKLVWHIRALVGRRTQISSGVRIKSRI